MDPTRLVPVGRTSLTVTQLGMGTTGIGNMASGGDCDRVYAPLVLGAGARVCSRDHELAVARVEAAVPQDARAQRAHATKARNQGPGAQRLSA